MLSFNANSTRSKCFVTKAGDENVMKKKAKRMNEQTFESKMKKKKKRTKPKGKRRGKHIRVAHIANALTRKYALTFSPLSDGKQNVSTVKNDIPMHGIMIFTV